MSNRGSARLRNPGFASTQFQRCRRVTTSQLGPILHMLFIRITGVTRVTCGAPTALERNAGRTMGCATSLRPQLLHPWLSCRRAVGAQVNGYSKPSKESNLPNISNRAAIEGLQSKTPGLKSRRKAGRQRLDDINLYNHSPFPHCRFPIALSRPHVIYDQKGPI